MHTNVKKEIQCNPKREISTIQLTTKIIEGASSIFSHNFFAIEATISTLAYLSISNNWDGAYIQGLGRVRAHLFWKWSVTEWLMVRGASNPVCKGLPLRNSGISDKIFFLASQMILPGKEGTALFQTHRWEKSNIFSSKISYVLGKAADRVEWKCETVALHTI